MYKTVVIIYMLLLICVIGGCSKENDLANKENEILETIDIYYCIDVKKAIHNEIEVNFREEEPYVLYTDRENKIEKMYKIYNVDRLENFIKDNVIGVDEKENDSAINPILEEQLGLWEVNIYTNRDNYCFYGSEGYPKYWKMLWDVIVEVTEVKDVTEFGLDTQDGFLKKNVIDAELHFFSTTETDEELYILKMDLNDNLQITVEHFATGEKKIYKLRETKKIEEILKNMIVQELSKSEINEDNSWIWRLDIRTDDKRSYRKFGQEADSTLWSELMETLVDVTDAESVKDLGLE